MSERRDWPRFRSVLSRPAYRRLWLARTVSQVGDVAQFTTVALLVLHLTGSGLGVSGAVVAEIAPVLLLAPLAGSLADRLPRVRVMVSSDLVRLALAAVLAAWHSEVVVVYAVAFGLSAGSVFFNPATNSLLPSIVDEDELVAANSGIWSAAVLVQIGAAPVAGVVAVNLGFGWAFAVNAVSFGASALFLRGLRSSEPPRAVAPANIWTDGTAALRLLGRDPLLRALALAQALAALSAGATSALLVLLAADHLRVSGGVYGLMLTAIAIGAVLGPVLLSRVAARVPAVRIISAAFALRGLVDLVLATVRALPAALGVLALYGVGTSAGTITFTSLIQRHVPAELRGRVFAGFDLIWQTMRLTSILAGGLIADRLGIRVVYYAGGVLLLAAAAVGFAARGAPRAVTGSPGR